MFDRKDSKSFTDLIGPDTVVYGDISFKGTIRIAGCIYGSVQSSEKDSLLILEKSGSISSQHGKDSVIVAKNMQLDGCLVASKIICADKLEILENAVVIANTVIYYNKLSIKNGARLSGCKMVYTTEDVVVE